MSLASMAGRVEQILDRYQSFLAELSEEEFQRNPIPGVWSYSEVYSHVITVNEACIAVMGKCIEGQATASQKKLHPVAWLILFLGKFPPVKIKAPERIAAMVQKPSKKEVAADLLKFKENLQAILPKIAGASLFQKAPHPRLGLLNARQWLRFVEIHTKHHQKQLDRIGKALKA